jgi:hypothetical protein
LLLGEVVDSNLGPLASHGDRNCSTCSGVSSGNQGTAPIKTSATLVALLTTVGLGGEISLKDWRAWIGRELQLQVAKASSWIDQLGP